MGIEEYMTCRAFLEKEFFCGEEADKGVCLAFSGGVDSGVLLRLLCDARDAAGSQAEIYAVTLETRLHPRADKEAAERTARECKAVHKILTVQEENNKELMKNTKERCYICKRYLFHQLLHFAEMKNIPAYRVVEGTNADDLTKYRPGIRAVRELGIISPFASLGISKSAVRAMGRELGLSVADRPSAPCLATRLPYGTPIDFSCLSMLEKGEEYLKSQGFLTVRIRLHGEVARIELQPEDFMPFLVKKESIVKRLRAEGFRYLTLDLEGFRSGSMDEYLDHDGLVTSR